MESEFYYRISFVVKLEMRIKLIKKKKGIWKTV